MNEPGLSVQSVAARYLESLAGLGLEYVFANAGTDFAPIIEAMVWARNRRRRLPTIMTVPHENVAVAMAHGYFRLSGKPAAVMVHVTVGTANAVCGIMNAARDNVPVLLAAGRTPHTESGHAGSRDAWIHWGQDCFDQGGMLREYVKWDYELRAGQPVETVAARALDIAMSEPRGPVYLTLPREVLGDLVPEPPLPVRRRPLGASAPAPAAEGIEALAALIAGAEFPLILTSSAGRDPANVARLAALAEDFAIGLGQPYARDVNIPSGHPMNLGSRPQQALARADLVLMIDCPIPWTTPAEGPGGSARLVHMGVDPFFSRYPLRGFGVDLAISGATSMALDMLRDALAARARDMRAAIAARRKAIAGLQAARAERMTAAIAAHRSTSPIHPVWLASCINRVKAPDTVVINELGVSMDFLELSEAGTYLTSSPAGGLGFGLGGALGAKLAAPARNVILVVGDGSYMFGNPTAAHFVAAAEGLPTLTVVANNRSWLAVHEATAQMYPDGAAVSSGQMPLVELTPSPAYEKTIEACGGYGERVEDPGELPAALERGLEAVAGGTPALLNVIVQARR